MKRKHFLLLMILLAASITLLSSGIFAADSYLMLSIQIIDVETNTIEKSTTSTFDTDEPNNATVVQGFIEHEVGSIVSSVAASQDRLAVLTVKTEDISDNRIESLSIRFMESAFVNSGKYVVVNRSDIEAALQEMEQQSSDLYNQATAVRLGNFVGANKVVIAELMYFGEVVAETTRGPKWRRGWYFFGFGTSLTLGGGIMLIPGIENVTNVTTNINGIGGTGIAFMAIGFPLMVTGVIMLINHAHVSAAQTALLNNPYLQNSSFGFMPMSDGAFFNFAYRW